MKNKKQELKKYIFIWIFLGIFSLSGVTLAWIVFNKSTNVTPLTGGSVSSGEGNLLISNQENGTFAYDCELILDSHSEALSPVSTSNLNTYYQSSVQNIQGITILYDDVSAYADEKIVRGSVYLKSVNAIQDIYFYSPKLDFGSDSQALAALRLGLKVKDEILIFNLSNMMDTTIVLSQKTVPEKNVVVNQIERGKAEYIADSSKNITEYYADISSGTDKPRAGSQKICTIQKNEIVKVEYFLYLEGCDSECINPVQQKDVVLQLAFAGVKEN